MYNNGNSSKNVTGSSVDDGTLENADFADNTISGDKIDAGVISNFQSTGIDDRLPTGKVLTLSTTGVDVTGKVDCDSLTVDSGGVNNVATFSSTDVSAYLNLNDNTQSNRFNASGSAFRIEADPSNLVVNSSITFTVDGSEKARILSSGGITFNGDTAAANALDDYEEGEFTPDIQPASGSITWDSSSDTLAYTKIGRVVHIQGRLIVSSVSSPSGITRGTLPFALPNLSEHQERTAGCVRINGTSLNVNEFGLYPTTAGSYIEIIRTNVTATPAGRDAGAYLGAGDYLDFNYTYIAT